MPKLLIEETFINATRGYRFGSSEPCEPYSDDLDRIFADLRSEYGGVTSKVYVDRMDGPPIHCGWTFSKRMRYDDARGNADSDHYTREVWVSVYVECSTDDPDAHRTISRTGAITIHPFKVLDIDAHRRQSRRNVKSA